MEAETLSDTLANVRAESLLLDLADTGAEVEAEALWVLKPYAEVEILNEDYTQDHKFYQVQA